MTLEALAKQSGVKKSHLNNIERSKTSPRLSEILKIAAALRCPPWKLFDWPD